MGPGRWPLVLLAVLGLARALSPVGGASASSRPHTPLTVSIARAEVIAAARVLGVTPPNPARPGSGRVDAELLRVFKGAPAGPRITIALRPFEDELVHRLTPGLERVLFLEPAGLPGVFRLTDWETPPHDETMGRRLDAAVPRMPEWAGAPGGLMALAVPDHDPPATATREPFRYRAGDPVILWAGYRNGSTRSVHLRYRDWPLESHTHWTLRVERSGAGTVEPVAHPHVTSAAIREFFSRNPHRFDVTLRPGESFFLYLDRINSAEPGWGYKERLDFRYYPMDAPGEYAITAVGRFFHEGPPIPARALRVWVE